MIVVNYNTSNLARDSILFTIIAIRINNHIMSSGVKKCFKVHLVENFCAVHAILPGSWIYPQSVDFWGRKLSMDSSKPKAAYC